jgi:hypothetical protein
MFAFCPHETFINCGMKDPSDHKLVAIIDRRKLYAKNLQYNKKKKRYDACYFEISASQDAVKDIKDPKDGIRVHI